MSGESTSGDGWALWIIRSKHKHEFRQTRFTPACTRTPRSGVIHHSHRYWRVHQGAHYPPTALKTWKYLHALAQTPWKSLCWCWNSHFCQMTHTHHLVMSSLVASCVRLFLRHSVPSAPLLLATSIVTSLRQHLLTRYHLMTAPSPCSLSVMKSVNNVW